MTYNRVARGMLHDDRVVLAILLCRIHLKGMPRYVQPLSQTLTAIFTLNLSGGSIDVRTTLWSSPQADSKAWWVGVVWEEFVIT